MTCDETEVRSERLKQPLQPSLPPNPPRPVTICSVHQQTDADQAEAETAEEELTESETAEAGPKNLPLKSGEAASEDPFGGAEATEDRRSCQRRSLRRC